MKLNQFREAISSLVIQWNQSPEAVTEALDAIYHEIRNSTAHQLAEALQQREQALRLYHKALLEAEQERIKK